MDSLVGKRHVCSVSLKEIDPNQVNLIHLFIKDQLTQVTGLDEIWHDGSWWKHLVTTSAGHIGWAAAACQFMKGNGKLGRDPIWRLRLLLDKNYPIMDQLYIGILDGIFGDDDEDLDIDCTLRRYQLVMGSIITANQPLLMTHLKELCLEKNRPLLWLTWSHYWALC
jgi:hypothetical protein